MFFALLISCSAKKHHEVQRSFYYWRSNLSLSDNSASALRSLHVKKLYVKFFDVVWNDDKQLPVPAATLTIDTASIHGIALVPVVFITNEVMAKITTTEIDSLGQKMLKLVNGIASRYGIQTGPEIQIDCDWTASTRDKYFALLRYLRQHLPSPSVSLSATIRLHQLKYKKQTGLPPVDKGLLMCYNMGNLQKPNVRNSIFDVRELNLYIDHADDYELPLDVALPIFDWYVWFRGTKFRGLIHSYDLDTGFQKNLKTNFFKDTVINDYAFGAQDWIRYENSDPEELMKGIQSVKNRIRSGRINVVLYHLDDINLKKFTIHEMEALYNGFD